MFRTWIIALFFWLLLFLGAYRHDALQAIAPLPACTAVCAAPVSADGSTRAVPGGEACRGGRT